MLWYWGARTFCHSIWPLFYISNHSFPTITKQKKSMKETLQLVGSVTAFFSQAGPVFGLCKRKCSDLEKGAKPEMENIHRILCIYRKMNKLILHLSFFRLLLTGNGLFWIFKTGPKRAQAPSSAVSEHCPNLYIALNPPNFSLHITFKVEGIAMGITLFELLCLCI